MQLARTEPTSLLIVDDEPSARFTLAVLLQRAGYRVDTAATVEDAIAQMQQQSYRVVITDLQMAGPGGLEVIKTARQGLTPPEVIVLTAFGSISSVVETMKLGADNYLTKPFEPEEMLHTIQQTLARQRQPTTTPLHPQPLRAPDPCAPLVTESPQMQRVLAVASRAAKTDATLLLQGESGTGKEVLAKTIHAWSARATRSFITIDCTTLSESLLESELFGHEKGAFTGAHAPKKGLFEVGDGGTIFLDEIGELPLAMQARLLRVLQERTIRRVGNTTPIAIDIRILTATNRHLPQLVQQGAFRHDLYYRLNGIVLQLPPLRERQEDICALAQHFVRRAHAWGGRQVQGLSPEVLDFFLRYPWPGNVRELAKVIEWAVIMGQSPLLTIEDLPPQLLEGDAVSSIPQPERLTLGELERTYILNILTKQGWNLTKSAEALGVNRTTLWRKLKQYQLDGFC